ncbi:hypothetical protein AALF85_05740 [Jeotgalicoccus halotolerans]|uniref:hypothetical protein n=1 Tax=Jeotgalicoccus halotolerans TaxID=157227 RepID=UPI0035157988
MNRKNYFEILKEQGFDPHQEIENIHFLLNSTTYDEYYSLQKGIERNFLNYKNRKSFIKFEQLEEVVRLKYDDAAFHLFNYTEMIIDLSKDIIEPYIANINERYAFEFLSNQYQALQYQIKNFLNVSNHELIENESGNLIVVEKNMLANQASQIISDLSLKDSIKILKYNHFSNEGDIETKKQILLSLANLLEPKRDDLNKKLGKLFKQKSNGKVEIVSDLFEMFNKLHLRHNDKHQYITSKDVFSLEHWYDSVYNTILMVIVSEEQVKIHEEFETLKKYNI